MTQNILVVAVNSVLFLLSLYFLWGWVTISDIKAQCGKHGYDVEKVLESMLSESVGTNSSTQVGNDPFSYRPANDDSLFKRLKIGESLFLVRDGTNQVGQPYVERIQLKVGYLDPFFRVSDNVVNVVFTFGVGYIMSSVLVVLALLKKKSVTKTFCLLRPIAGAMVSVCLFIIILSGGKILWESATHPNGLSVGIIAAIGSLYCERFEKILAKSIPSRENLQKPSDNPGS